MIANFASYNKTFQQGVVLFCALLLVILAKFNVLTPRVNAAETIAATPGKLTIDQLIAQLGAPQFGDREIAQAQLKEIGPDAVPALQKAATEGPDPEIRSRAAAVVMRITEHETRDASLITLHKKDADEQDVLDEVGHQAHAKLQGNGQTITIDVNRMPYWDVMSEICIQLNVCPSVDQSGLIRLLPMSDNWVTQSPHQIVGPYWISCAGFTLNKNVDLFGKTATQTQFSVALRVLPEPKLPVKRVFDLELAEANDDAGHSLLPLIHHELKSAMAAGSGAYSLASSLTYPDHAGTKITALRGQFSVLLAPEIHSYQVDDVLGNPLISNPLKDCPVRVKVTPYGRDMFRVNLTGSRKGLSDAQWAMSEIMLVDAENLPLTTVDDISSSAKASKGTTGEEFFVNGLFSRKRNRTKSPPTTEPEIDRLRLIWNVPVRFVTVTVPFDLNDLPMP